MLAIQPVTTSYPASGVVDSGATYHMCNNKEDFRKNSLGLASASVRLGDNSLVSVEYSTMVKKHCVFDTVGECAKGSLLETRISMWPKHIYKCCNST